MRVGGRTTPQRSRRRRRSIRSVASGRPAAQHGRHAAVAERTGIITASPVAARARARAMSAPCPKGQWHRARAASRPGARDTPVRRPAARDDGEGGTWRRVGRACARGREQVRGRRRSIGTGHGGGRRRAGAEACVYVGANSCRRRDARVSRWPYMCLPAVPVRADILFCWPAAACRRERIRSGGFAKRVPTATAREGQNPCRADCLLLLSVDH